MIVSKQLGGRPGNGNVHCKHTIANGYTIRACEFLHSPPVHVFVKIIGFRLIYKYSPALAGYGVDQSHDLATFLVKLKPPIQKFYSSPFYRCIQTISPTLAKLETQNTDPPAQLKIYGDNGIGEWYGRARFDHPSPAQPELLHKLFPLYEIDYKPSIIPSVNGESIDELHDRVAYALHKIIEDCDREGAKAILICTHAASLIAIGRVLVGRMPENIEEEDFRPFTCGLSTFIRRSEKIVGEVKSWSGVENDIPSVPWREGEGVKGGWNCILSGDCSFLKGGEERGWRFSGDESFITGEKSPVDVEVTVDAGNELGVVIEGVGKKSERGPKL